MGVAVIRKLLGSLLCWAYFVDMLSMGVCKTRHWSSGAGIKCLYCSCGFESPLDNHEWAGLVAIQLSGILKKILRHLSTDRLTCDMTLAVKTRSYTKHKLV